MVLIREEFVKQSIIKWLIDKNYKISKITNEKFGVDIKAYNYNGEEYIIECKGETKGENSYLDFCTGLGQLILRMDKGLKPWKHYALGLPNTGHFHRQIGKYKKLPVDIQKFFKIQFLLVNSEGSVVQIKK
ncbi:MAG: hypothetical protein ACOZAL_01740 [Patescibacteria group bacterium]